MGGFRHVPTSPDKAAVDEAKKARIRTRKSNAATKLKSQGGRADLASIDVVRIAVGKKVFKSKCRAIEVWEEDSVYLNNNELRGLNYFVESDDDSLADNADESTTVICDVFPHNPTEKNEYRITVFRYT